MKYSFKINASDLPIVIEAHKEVGGYLEIAPDSEGRTVTVTFDNPDLTNAERLWMVKYVYDKPIQENGASIIRAEIIKVFNEILDFDNDVKPELQKKKIQEQRQLDYNPEGTRTKWEIIKALQGEFEKFPDDTVFTGFKAIGIGKFGTRYI